MHLWWVHQNWTWRPGASAETLEWKQWAIVEKEPTIFLWETIGSSHHLPFFNNQMNKTLCAQTTKPRISHISFFKKKKRKPKQHYPLLAHSLICSRSHFLMLHEALHSCATGERFSVAEKWDFPPKGRYNSKGTIKLLYMSDIKT